MLTRQKKGKLDLVFKRDPDGRTYVDKQYSSYPFHFCRPFYFDCGDCQDMATVYIQSCSGGLYTQDSLEMNISAMSDTKVHLTTQASTIVHEGMKGAAVQAVNISVAENALVEYLPDPVIMLPAANLDSRLFVTVDPRGSAIIVDSLITHDFEDLDRPFEQYKSNLVIRDLSQRPQVIDRYILDGKTFAADQVGVMGKYSCHANVILFGSWAANEETLKKCRTVLHDMGAVMAGVSMLPGALGLSVRVLAEDALDMKNAVHETWVEARRNLFGADPILRRK